MAELPPFAELLAGCERSAVHLEMRDWYDVPSERFEAWKCGHREDPADRSQWWSEFHQTIADAVKRGVQVKRARVVSEPITDYIRFEYDVTFSNLAVGEQVRWLPRRRASDVCLPGNDFWCFDDRLVRFHHFSGAGAHLEDEMVSDPAVAKLCATAFEMVWERAIPHSDYRPV